MLVAFLRTISLLLRHCRRRNRWPAGVPSGVVAGTVATTMALVGAACAWNKGEESAPGLDFEPCHLSVPGTAQRVRAECALFAVPEDRTAPGGREIRLRVARLPAVSRRPYAEAFVFLAGGPGQAATESWVSLARAMDPINRRRDIILLDQRGTGGPHALRCPEAEKAESAPGSGPREEAAAAARECLATLDADVRQYTTAAAVADLEALRAELGYTGLDILGVSYGTRVALAYARRHPERVRTMILDGVVPPDEALGVNVARYAQGALNAWLSRCDVEQACRDAFGNTQAAVRVVFDGADATAAPLTVPHPTTGEATTIVPSRAIIAGATRLLLYAPETAVLLPYLFHSAANGELQPLLALALMVGEGLSATISAPVSYSVSCSEDVPFYGDATALDATGGTFLADLVSGGLEAVCAEWPTMPPADALEQPFTADIPALLLSGELDPITPPSWGDRVALNLPRARHIVAPGQGHNVVARGCLPRLVAEFVESGDAMALDDACVAAMVPAPLILGPTGPYRADADALTTREGQREE